MGINEFGEIGSAPLKAKAKKKPTRSLTAQLKTSKVLRREALLSLKEAQLKTATLEAEITRLTQHVIDNSAVSQPSPQWLIDSIAEYRSAVQSDDATDALLLRLTNRLTNLG